MIEGILVEGLLYGIMALGVFITFRILNFPDLSVDGTFPLGAAILGMAVLAGVPLLLGVLLAFLGGAAAGAVTATIHNKLKVPNLLAGILTMTMLWSVNIRVLGNRANLSLLRTPTVLSRATTWIGQFLPYPWSVVAFFLLLALVLKFLLDLFFHTDLGLTLGAMGDNQQMVVSQGVNPEIMKVIGLSLSNGLVALAGAFAAQYQGFADVNMGQGIVVAGLASVMIGEFLLRSNRIGLLTFRVILGSIAYRGVMYLGRYYGYHIRMTPNDLRLLTGILIIVSLMVSHYQSGRAERSRLEKTFLPDLPEKDPANQANPSGGLP
ncbi:ABC transporter permease [Alkalispirochaeta sphaeroplastigenens]|uniref:ABC transporter permease n=1 Tax=Alkalispirochaeta sphaeroplastigenens TaxID=1187066 RepID=A0A2S4JRS8_9SPIO|nr:ABC transporter permease [Alkalispirochaeta sphaeroplastigenens]POR02234.1 ABC transporter permease [Alkalispirochaeta sphaeroplastigenens]